VNTCVCGHEPDAHYATTGACEWLVDEFPCYCPRYEWQGDQ